MSQNIVNCPAVPFLVFAEFSNNLMPYHALSSSLGGVSRMIGLLEGTALQGGILQRQYQRRRGGMGHYHVPGISFPQRRMGPAKPRGWGCGTPTTTGIPRPPPPQDHENTTTPPPQPRDTVTPAGPQEHHDRLPGPLFSRPPLSLLILRFKFRSNFECNLDVMRQEINSGQEFLL